MTENNTTSCSSDMPAIVDKLGTEEQQKGLVEFMRHCSTPMTIAVQGDWGTGKTSMMRLLEKELKKENGSTLWFPTWQFAVLGEQDRLLMDLLMLLCCKLKEKCSEMDEKDEVLFHKLFRFIKRVGRASAIGGLYLAAETGKTLTGIDCTNVLDKSIDTLEEQDEEENKSDNLNEINITYESYVMQVSKLHEDLTKLIDAYLEANGTKRLYIFIDDLDRLEPVRAVELLEGIKNFLDIPRCVFMLAIDTKVVMEGLKAKYGGNMDEDKLIHFFDKIIQIPYKLPVHNYKLKAFMEDVLEGYDKENADKYVEFLESADIRNPRTIKRCVNFCLLHHYMDGEDAVSLKDKDVKLHLFAVKMLELEREDLYWILLGKVRALGSKYDDLKAWLLVDEKLKCDFFDKVLKCFEIEENAVETKIKLFANYIVSSAPDDIGWAKYIEDAQKIYNLINRIENAKKYNRILDFSTNLPKSHSVITLPVYEIAKKIEENGDIGLRFEFKNIEVYINYESKRNYPLYMVVSGFVFEDEFLEKYCENRLKSPIKDKRKIICHKNDASYCIFDNIQDTSSPDAPIYKILQAAGVIEIPTELTPIAP